MLGFGNARKGARNVMSSTNEYGKVVVLNNRRSTSNEAGTASPRDILLAMLAEIDQGLPVEELVITFDCGIHGCGFKNATKSMKSAVGLLQVCQMELHYAGAAQS